MRNLLIEISAVDPASPGIPVTLRASTASSESSGVNLDNKEWAPVIIGGPEFDYSYWAEGQPQGLDTSYGNITFLLDPVSGSNVWPKYSFEGANATIWVGAFGDAFGAYRKIWSGKLGPLVRDSDQQAHIPLLGAEADLVRDLLSTTYAGTGGVEGGSALRGAWKPYSVGACVNVAPVLIDAAKWVYQVNAYDPTPINAIYEAALRVDIAATVSTYAELIALTIPDGKAAACPSLGLFRLKNEPAGKITADIGSPATVGTVAASLMSKAGLSGSRIDASVSATPRAYSLYVVDQTSILDAIRDAAFAGSRFMLANSEGVFCFVPIVSTKAAGVLSSKRDARPLVQPDKIVQEPTALPAYRVRIGHTRVWAVHSTNEISPSIAELAADQTALDAAAKLAQETADLAKAQADLAVGLYNTMVADGILDRAEKRRVIERFESFTAERTGLLAQASSQGVTTERTAYANAYAALNTYLTGLSPAYNDTAQDTPINATDFKAAFVNYDVAKQNLVNALANKAAQTAGWTNVSGRPTNLVELDPGASEKLDQTFENVADLQAASVAHLTGLANAEVARIRDRALHFPGPDGASTYTLHKREEAARTTADEAFADTIELIGAVTPSGDAFVLNGETVKVTKTEAGATVLQSVSARFADNEGSIESIKQVFIDENGTLSRALLRVDANGRVIGFAATNDGRRGDFTVTADRFEIVDPDTGTAYFYADDTGKVVMRSVEVDTLKVGAMDAEFTSKQLPFNGFEGTQALPGGVVMKWGRYRARINDETTFTIVFNQPFPSSCDAFIPTPYIASFSNLRDLWIQNVGAPTRFGATIATQAATSNQQNLDGFDWVAFGR